MADLVDAQPSLDPDLDRLPSDLWGALVLQVIGQQLSLAAAAAILTRLEALQGDRMPTPAELLAVDAETLRGIGMSRATAAYCTTCPHDPKTAAWTSIACAPSTTTTRAPH
jgi:DNA-3-methyladenine glycosylase II